MKKPQFPVAKYREDGTPAIWLTFNNWMAIKDGLVREYIVRREYIAMREARKAAGKPQSLDTWGTHFEINARDAALELYRIGYEAHQAACHMTPAQLVEHGDRLAKRAFDEETLRLSERRGEAAASPEHAVEAAA